MLAVDPAKSDSEDTGRVLARRGCHVGGAFCSETTMRLDLTSPFLSIQGGWYNTYHNARCWRSQ
jgi:hypothetical protein